MTYSTTIQRVDGPDHCAIRDGAKNLHAGVTFLCRSVHFCRVVAFFYFVFLQTEMARVKTSVVSPVKRAAGKGHLDALSRKETL